MARTAKQGLGYFPFDIDFFQDLRIRKLIKDGYYIRWDEELPFIISEQTGYDEAYIREVIQCCLNIGLFSKELFRTEGVLTSKGIQVRYMNINRLCKRVATVSVYDLTDDSIDGKPAGESSHKLKPKKRAAATKTTMTPPAPTFQPYTLTLDEEIDALKSETGWLDQLQVLHHMDIAALRIKLDEFRLHCASDGKDRHESLSDAKQHFNNWLRIVANKPSDNNAKDKTTRQNKRSGNLLGADEKKTYGGTF